MNNLIDTLNFLSFQVHGSGAGHKASDGLAGTIENFLTFAESLVGLTPPEMFAKIFPGIASMANIHPMVVHFPIALLIAFFLVDSFGTFFRNGEWRRVATSLLYLGTASAGVAVYFGLQAASTVDHGENVHLILEQHEFIGLSILGLSALLSLWRLLNGGFARGIPNVIFISIAAVLAILIVFSADLGGLMVYKYGVAVEAVEVNTLDYFKEHTHSH